MAHQSVYRIQEADATELLPQQRSLLYLCGYVSRLVRDEMAVMFLETCISRK